MLGGATFTGAALYRSTGLLQTLIGMFYILDPLPNNAERPVTQNICMSTLS